MMRTALALGVLAAACGVRDRPVPTAIGPDAWLTHGPVVGETTDTSARLWARCAAPGALRVALEPGHTPGSVVSAPVTPARDFTATITLDRLRPGTRYAYRAWCGAGRDRAVRGVFRTAPLPADPAPVRFAFGADLGGQNVCRDRVRGYPVLDVIAARRPDFFVALGDMIYADDPCLERGRLGNAQVPGPGVARDLGGFWAHWRYSREDSALRRLLAAATYYAAWDDHEVANDAGPRNTSGPALLLLGRQAFLDHHPIRGALYRRFRWGQHLELFVLDTRSDRDANAAPDRLDGIKTMLGPAQRAWLEEGLAATDATWKVIVSSVPLAVPTGTTARDGWADGGGPTGFERELLGVLASAAQHGVANLVWLTGDVHHAAGYRYRPFSDHTRFVVHELIASPLHAGLFPTLSLDETLGPERLFFHGPTDATAVSSLDAALPWFNFGQVEIGAEGDLRAEIVDATGRTRYQLALTPLPPSADPR
jgi:alkaline phosphatase D